MLSLAQAEAALPLDSVLTLGGKTYHAHWLGGVSGFVFYQARFGLAGSPEDLAGSAVNYFSGPLDATPVDTFTSALVSGGWKFYSARCLNEYNDYQSTHSSYGWSHSDLVSPLAGDINFGYYNPFRFHAVLCDMTDTTRSGAADPGFYPFEVSDGAYALYREEEAAILASDVASDMSGGSSENVVVLAIDGSGSFNSGELATTYLDNFINAFSAAKPGNNVTLILTKFSDYGGPEYYDSTDIPGLLCGTWTGINPGITAAVIAAVTAPENDTGSGGDTNETQIEGMWVGMQAASGKSGDKAIVVYTDAASVIVFGGTRVVTVVRQYPRDDALGLGSAPRIHPPPMHSRFHPGLQ